MRMRGGISIQRLKVQLTRDQSENAKGTKLFLQYSTHYKKEMRTSLIKNEMNKVFDERVRARGEWNEKDRVGT